MVWVNGRLAGTHEGGNTPFSFDVTPLLQAGRQRDHRPRRGSARPTGRSRAASRYLAAAVGAGSSTRARAASGRPSGWRRRGELPRAAARADRRSTGPCGSSRGSREARARPRVARDGALEGPGGRDRERPGRGGPRVGRGGHPRAAPLVARLAEPLRRRARAEGRRQGDRSRVARTSASGVVGVRRDRVAHQQEPDLPEAGARPGLLARQRCSRRRRTRRSSTTSG